jgi:hypothetical protein
MSAGERRSTPDQDDLPVICHQNSSIFGADRAQAGKRQFDFLE